MWGNSHHLTWGEVILSGWINNKKYEIDIKKEVSPLLLNGLTAFLF